MVEAAVGANCGSFLVVPNFVSPDVCAQLADAMVRHAPRRQRGVDPFWDDRVLFRNDILDIDPSAADVMKRVDHGVKRVLRDNWPERPLMYNDGCHLVRWTVGPGMPPHADHQNEGFAHREFAAVLYLNDDFDGGELRLTRLGIVIRPETGTLVIIPSTWEHEHEVLPITRGERYTMAGFYTSDAAKADLSPWGVNQP